MQYRRICFPELMKSSDYISDSYDKQFLFIELIWFANSIQKIIFYEKGSTVNTNLNTEL